MIAQYLRQGCNISVEEPFIASLARPTFGTLFALLIFYQHTQSAKMCVRSRHQHGARWRACRCGMVIEQPDTLRGEPINIWGLDLRAITSNVGESLPMPQLDSSGL